MLTIALRGLLDGDDFSGFFNTLVPLFCAIGTLDGLCGWLLPLLFEVDEASVEIGRCCIIGGAQSGDIKDSGTGIIFEFAMSA